MNGPAHWREADLILTGDADPCSYGCPHSGCPHSGCPHSGCPHEMSMLTRAIGHGLLALAAAVVDGPAVMRPGTGTSGIALQDALRTTGPRRNGRARAWRPP